MDEIKLPIIGLKKNDKSIVGDTTDMYYGVEIDFTVADPALVRIGKAELHVSLPIQNKMRRCLLRDDGTVAYYLHPNDSTKRMDGKPANLDGTDGMVMVEIPAHYRKFEVDGTKTRVLLSEYELPGYHFVPMAYRSAFEAAVDRTDTSKPKLASVVNDSADFRGGNNYADWDGTYRSLLGMPATNINITDFREYARNRGDAGKNGAGWNCDVYEIQKTCYWLYVVEYANLNCQLEYNAEPTSEGYKQGGLGQGVTNMIDWYNYNRCLPIVPCGVTNSLGNKTGVVNYTYKKSNGTDGQTLSVPSYRGLENPFGHVGSYTDGCKCNIQISDSGEINSFEFFVCTDPEKFQSDNFEGYEKRGDFPKTIKRGYIKSLMIGEYGENMPKEIGASSTTYFADHFSMSTSKEFQQRTVVLGGAADYEGWAGFVNSDTSVQFTYQDYQFGSRLCFLPE